VNSPVLAPAPAGKNVSSERAVAFHALSLDFTATPAFVAVNSSAIIDIGPPVDLVISLHCLLI
jgi:hypothetical protein